MVDEGDGWYSFERTISADDDFYCRLRGTNLPPGTPYETYSLDTEAPEGPGGPMLDSEAGNIVCTDCPLHTMGSLTTMSKADRICGFTPTRFSST